MTNTTPGLNEASAPPPKVKFTFSSGGWVLVLSLVLVFIFIAWKLPHLLTGQFNMRVGDGENVATYGFDLSTCLVDRDKLTTAGIPKDHIRPLTEPKIIDAAMVEKINKHGRSQFLLPDDRIVGVLVGGQARAYPVRMLNWHEIVNDVVAGVPVAVTYHPPCDSVVAFDRRIGDEVLTFGGSGLLYNGNLLMYDDREDPARESLWCQLQFRAITGPAAEAGRELELYPAFLVTWGEWLANHPKTEVLAPIPALADNHKKRPYSNYFSTSILRFPVDPLPPQSHAEQTSSTTAGGAASAVAASETSDFLPYKAKMLAVRAKGSWTLVSIDRAASEGQANDWHDPALPDDMTIRVERDPPFAYTTDPDRISIPCLYFAWFAQYPDTPVIP